MTHGDKAKAKTGKSSQASDPEKAVKAAAGRKGGSTESRAGGKAGSSGGKVDKIAVKKQSGPDEGSAAAGSSKKESGGKARAAGSGDSGGFSNPAIAAAFRRAVEKYPNAFRKLTD